MRNIPSFSTRENFPYQESRILDCVCLLKCSFIVFTWLFYLFFSREGDAPLPQIPSSYLRLKWVSFVSTAFLYVLLIAFAGYFIFLFLWRILPTFLLQRYYSKFRYLVSRSIIKKFRLSYAGYMLEQQSLPLESEIKLWPCLGWRLRDVKMKGNSQTMWVEGERIVKMQASA